MPPRTLLFSSDQEASRGLAQALLELDLEVEHCDDIFAGVERLTHQSYDVIVADCDEGPEAAFLLRTARELKPNATLFALAITSAEAKLEAQEIGADLVLTKPIIPEPCKYELLLCDRFLACLRTWLSAADLATAPESAVVSAASPGKPQQEKSAAPTLPTPPAQPPSPAPLSAAPVPPVNLTFATLDRRLFRSSTNLMKPNPNAAAKPAPRGHKTLMTTTISAVFLSLGYLLSQPVHVKNAAASERPQQQQNAVLQTAQRDDANIRVIPVYRAAVSPTTSPVKQPQPLAPAATSPQITASTSVRIPESIAAQRGPGRTPSLLSELEPVSLPEDSSEALLLQKVQPTYPLEALKAGLQGAVLLQASIARDGSIRDLKIVQGSLLLGKAAYHAVKQWRYHPYLRNGQAVEAQTFVTVDFRLPQESLLTSQPR